MRGLLVSLSILVIFALIPQSLYAQTDQPQEGDSALSQPLIREGALAVRLAEALGLGTPENEAEGESLLSEAGISPRNGWIADYPLTPDIVGELQNSIGEAADSGKLSIGKDAALNTFQDVMTGYGLAVKPDVSDQQTEETPVPNYPDPEMENSYYESEGPPVVTYYAPPPDYAYLYTWVPYPFWWTNFWFPGYFILADFNVRVKHHHRDRHYKDDGRDRGEFVSNHFRSSRTGKISRIDPANRTPGGAFPRRTGRTAVITPSGGGGQAILDKSRGRVQTGPTRTREFRGYGVGQNPVGSSSSAFEHSVNRKVEHPASDRGFQSRSSAGQVPAAGPARGSGGQSGGGSIGGGAVGGRTGGGGGGRAGGGFHGGGPHK
jgi:hypothetical protein